jgi:hypothetical protein
MTKKNFLLFSLFFLLLLSPFFSFAQTEILYPSLPGVVSPQEIIQTAESQEDVFPLFVTYLFQLLLLISSAVLLSIFLFGGILHIISGEDAEKKRAAKSWMLSSLQGALIVFLSYAVLFTLNSQLVLFQQDRLANDRERIERVGLEWKIKNIYYQIPFGLLIEDAILNETAQNKLYDTLDATYKAEDSADLIVEGSKQLLEIIETCPEGKECCDEENIETPPPPETEPREPKERDLVDPVSPFPQQVTPSRAPAPRNVFRLFEEGLTEADVPQAVQMLNFTEHKKEIIEIISTVKGEIENEEIVDIISQLEESLRHDNLSNEEFLEKSREVRKLLENYLAEGDLSDNDKEKVKEILARLPFADMGNNDVPYYFQKDGEWRNERYGRDGTVGGSGCLPMSAAMVIDYYTEEKIDPLDMFDGRFYISGVGTSFDLFRAKAQEYNLNYTTISTGSFSALEREFTKLEEGRPLIVTGRGYPFNSSPSVGHGIVLTGINREAGVVYVNDSNNPFRKTIRIDEFRKNPGGYVHYIRPKEESSFLNSGYFAATLSFFGIDYVFFFVCFSILITLSFIASLFLFQPKKKKKWSSIKEMKFSGQRGSIGETITRGYNWVRNTITHSGAYNAIKSAANTVARSSVGQAVGRAASWVARSPIGKAASWVARSPVGKAVGAIGKGVLTVGKYAVGVVGAIIGAPLWVKVAIIAALAVGGYYAYNHFFGDDNGDPAEIEKFENGTIDPSEYTTEDLERLEEILKTMEEDGDWWDLLTDEEKQQMLEDLDMTEEELEELLEELEEELPPPPPPQCTASPCPEIAPAVQAKIAEIEGYMAQLDQDLNELLLTKEPIKEDLYQLYKVIMLKSLGNRQVFNYTSYLAERRYYEREEVVVETDRETSQIGPYSWDWTQWIDNILYRIETNGRVIEENDPTTFYLRRPQANKVIEDALRLANEAKQRGVQNIGREVDLRTQSLERSFVERLFFFVKNLFSVNLETKDVFAQTGMRELEEYFKEQGINPEDASSSQLEEAIEALGLSADPSAEEFSIRDVRVVSPSEYLTCGMEIPVGEVFDLTWDHLIELLDTIDDYVEKGRELIEKQAKMNELARPCSCPCEGDFCPDECGQCVLTCDLGAIRSAHQEVLQTREELREIANHIELLTYGFFNTATEDLCDRLNEEIRDDGEKTLCQGGGSKMITKHELITRKLNYSRFTFDECITRPEHMEDVLEGRRAGKIPLFGPLVEEKKLERYTKTQQGGFMVNTSDFNWFCCSDSE